MNKNLIGEKYYNWEILEYIPREKNKEQYVLCKCLCGTIKKNILRTIVSGKSKSCGCYRKGVGKPVITNQMIVDKYNEVKSLKETARFFKKGDTYISDVLKSEGVKLYASLRKDPELIRKRLVKKVLDYRDRRIIKDPLYKFKNRTRSLISQTFIKKGYTKKTKTFEILGIDYRGFSNYIESQFIDGMSWDNYGEWVLDHKVPIYLGKSVEDVIKLNHYTNLQPLWNKDNQDKSNKILPEFEHLVEEYLGDVRVPPNPNSLRSI
jgi:hypothetical protein